MNMKNKNTGKFLKHLLSYLLLIFVLFLTACSATSTNTEDISENEESEAEEEQVTTNQDEEEDGPLTGKLSLDKNSGRIGDTVQLTAESLLPNEPLTVIWKDMVGSYSLEDNYTFIGTSYEEIEVELVTGEADENGSWTGEITIPEGFGDDHDIIIYQNDKKIAQANFFVETVFRIYPESGPIGTEITIEGEGLSWKMYGSLWHLNYDNKYTGMITAVSTNGKAIGKIRASGEVGDHVIKIEGGSSGSPFLNRDQSAINYISTHNFVFTVTDDEPVGEKIYVEDPPKAANGGIKLPDPVNKDGVTITIDKEMGTVGEPVVLKGEGLPANETITLDWHTMVGNRVSTAGFGAEVRELAQVTTDDSGSFTYEFEIPDDLGGLPHLIDVKVNDEIYGQTYLRILPSVVDISHSSAPVGTQVMITIKGSGWTEYDNAYAVTYDNAYIGYICGFNSQGTIELPIVVSGDPGYHVIDIYPSIYKGQQIQPNLYLNPQLTYLEDHPGTNIPPIRILFEVTE